MTVDPSATSGTDGHAGPVVLPLVDGPLQPRHTLASTTHTLLSFTALCLRIPFHLVWHYILYRRKSPYVQDLGRWWFHEPAVMLFRMLFSRTYIRPSRPFFRVALPSKYVGKMEDVAGTRGTWVLPPGTKGERKDDDLVMLWSTAAGGGFIIDTGVACQDFHVALAKDMENRGVRFSIFMVDYRELASSPLYLAPENIYPSQPIECLAAYHYLVNDLDIPPSKICFAGDSAGGNLVMSVLLHLARPNPAFALPKSVMLFSPFIDFLSRRPSRIPPYPRDYTDSGGVFHGVLHYLGLTAPFPPELAGWRHPPYWDLLSFFSGENSAEHPPEEVRVEKLRERVEEAEGGKRGLGLLANPYVSPSTEVVTDRSWYREALPGKGQTFVSWGGKEIFADDIEDFANVLDEAGVAPHKLVKPLGTHDWPLFDTMLPITARDRLGGEQSQSGYAVRKISEWLVERVKEKKE
ncbi:hypothetical protein JCM8097_007360 [Rhodosporidiobolus ruineniae]